MDGQRLDGGMLLKTPLKRSSSSKYRSLNFWGSFTENLEESRSNPVPRAFPKFPMEKVLGTRSVSIEVSVSRF